MKIITFLLIFLMTSMTYASPWMSDFENAQKLAIATNKLILVDFWATWCGPCKRMDDESWSDPEVQELMGYFVPLKINIDRDVEMSQRYNVRGIPHVFIMDANGEIVFHNLGYMDKEDVLEVLKKYALNTKFLQKETLNYYEHQNYVTSLRMAEKYLDFSLYLKDEVRNSVLDLAEEYLKIGEDLLDKDQSNYEFMDQKIELLQLTAELYGSNLNKLERNLEDYQQDEIFEHNRKLYAFLNFCLAKEKNDKKKMQKWNQVLASHSAREYQKKSTLLFKKKP